jgi:hypothetical protein
VGTRVLLWATNDHVIPRLLVAPTLYNCEPDSQTQKPSGSIEYEIDNAASHEKVMDFSEEVGSIPNASANQVTIEHLLPLRTFEPGAYTLKVTATDKNVNHTVQQHGSFTVSPF